MLFYVKQPPEMGRIESIKGKNPDNVPVTMSSWSLHSTCDKSTEVIVTLCDQTIPEQLPKEISTLHATQNAKTMQEQLWGCENCHS